MNIHKKMPVEEIFQDQRIVNIFNRSDIYSLEDLMNLNAMEHCFTGAGDFTFRYIITAMAKVLKEAVESNPLIITKDDDLVDDVLLDSIKGELGKTVVDVLGDRGIKTLSMLIKMTEKQFLEQAGLGKIALKKTKTYLESKGLSFSEYRRLKDPSYRNQNFTEI